MPKIRYTNPQLLTESDSFSLRLWAHFNPICFSGSSNYMALFKNKAIFSYFPAYGF